jgi:predicted site-specific integrase-resolvase
MRPHHIPNGTTPSPTRRTIIYARVSTREQGEEGYSRVQIGKDDWQWEPVGAVTSTDSLCARASMASR